MSFKFLYSYFIIGRLPDSIYHLVWISFILFIIVPQEHKRPKQIYAYKNQIPFWFWFSNYLNKSFSSAPGPVPFGMVPNPGL